MQLPEISRRQAVIAAVLALVALYAVGTMIGPDGSTDAARSRARLIETAGKSKAAVYVDVSGAVLRPGLYKLPAGSRVNDALAKAGGPTAKADLTLINRAALVSDGEQVLVPEKVDPASVAAGGSAPASPAMRLHLNTATLDQLDQLPGIGPATAQRIIDYRTAHGPFKSVDELDRVSGIGPARMAELRDLVVP